MNYVEQDSYGMYAVADSDGPRLMGADTLLAPTFIETAPGDVHSAKSIAKASMQLLGLPFDMVRHQYAYAQQVGLIAPSMVASAKFGCAVGALETLTLGPWARQV